MRDEKEISSQIESNADKLFGKDWLTKLAYSAGYMDGIAYADNHPNWEEIVERMRKEVTNDLRNDRWISVEEELPKEHEWILGYSLKREYIDVYNFDSNGLIEAHGITHWMSMPQAPKKGGEKMEKLTVEWQDPCNNHREKIKVLLYEKGMTSKEIVEKLCDVYKNEHVDLETLLYWAIQIGYNK